MAPTTSYIDDLSISPAEAKEKWFIGGMIAVALVDLLLFLFVMTPWASPDTQAGLTAPSSSIVDAPTDESAEKPSPLGPIVRTRLARRR